MKVLSNSIKMGILLFILMFVLLLGTQDDNFATEELFLFVFIGIFSVSGIVKEVKRKPYSMCHMHWLFVFFFFFIAPVIQISNNYSTWGIILTLRERILSEVFILLWSALFILGQWISENIIFKFGSLDFKYKKDEEPKNETSNSFLLIMTVLSFICGLYMFQSIGIRNLFARSTSSFNFQGDNAKTLSLLVSRIVRITIVYTNVVMIKAIKVKRELWPWMVFNFLILLLTSFPTGSARNAIAVIWLGVMVVVMDDLLKQRKYSLLYVTIFILGLIIIFPAINVFRRNDFGEANFIGAIQNTISEVSSSFLSADYDAFSVIGHTIRHVSTYGITFGKQLFGALLFFVPRSIWNTKPVGSGQMIFESFNASFTNISNPLIAEAYINFGIVGIAIFAVLCGYTCNKLDSLYWYAGKESSFMNKLYPFLLPSFFFMMRGDLLSTWSYTFAYIAVFYGYEKLRKIT